MDIEERLELEKRIVSVLKTIFDPEIPVNIFDLGLIYEVDVDDNRVAHVKMTLTAPNCPMADQLLEEVRYNVGVVPGISECDLKLTFDPPWDRSMLSDEAMLDLGLL
ncbi:MAG: iron-sulfur cluster assembly protein [Bacteroidales bacterium]|jgi:FeS assembly SUF system protein|nr:iron-sulfur cluster assembly protein [Bacteroidales bacterium]